MTLRLAQRLNDRHSAHLDTFLSADRLVDCSRFWTPFPKRGRLVHSFFACNITHNVKAKRRAVASFQICFINQTQRATAWSEHSLVRTISQPKLSPFARLKFSFPTSERRFCQLLCRCGASETTARRSLLPELYGTFKFVARRFGCPVTQKLFQIPLSPLNPQPA